MKWRKMKYKLHWLIFGLFALWTLEIISFIAEIRPSPEIIVLLSPLFIWGLFSMFDYIEIILKGGAKENGR